jgi:hypothetical protein
VSERVRHGFPSLALRACMGFRMHPSLQRKHVLGPEEVHHDPLDLVDGQRAVGEALT